MDSDKMWITTLAQDYINSQSFDFSSFSEAKHELFHKTKLCKKFIVYDRLSLCIYERNLSYDEYRQFSKEASHLYEPLNSDCKKRRLEYGILFHYLWCKSRLGNYSITKTERPDFILKKGEYSTGVEVTQLTTPYEKVMDKIASISMTETSVDDLKSKAEDQHGHKANRYHYYNFNDSVGVGTKTLNLTKIKEQFAEQIIKKYEKYEKNIKDYDEFIILCDAQQGITITSKNDLDGIINGLMCYPFSQVFRVAILWIDNGKLNCSQFKVDPSAEKFMDIYY